MKDFLTQKNHTFDKFTKVEMVNFVQKEKKKLVPISRPVAYVSEIDEMLSYVMETRNVGSNPIFKLL